jgi:UDP-N-acetylglucosamine acyltransferase
MHQPLAYINPEAKIAKNVIIEPFATIQKNVEIGEGTWIGPNAVIMEGARIGKNCKIFPGAVISAVPQDLKFVGEETTAVIGDNTTIRECVTINRGTQANWETRVGNNCILANNASLSGHVIVDDWAILNGFTAVQQFIHIGSHTYVAGGTLVRKDIPPFTKAAREPVSYVGINSVGLQRRKYTEEQIRAIQEIYRYIYLKNLNVNNALDLIEKELPQTPERDEILSFIRNSKIGIMRGSGGETE